MKKVSLKSVFCILMYYLCHVINVAMQSVCSKIIENQSLKFLQTINFYNNGNYKC